ncbi:RluA family pseudouridine synthase [Clostridiaceae bacterium 35-E11]
MREIYIGKNEENQRVDKFLRKYMPKASLSFIYKMIRKKNIKVNEKRINNDYMLQAKDRIQLYLSEETIQKFLDKKEVQQVAPTFGIVYEDENILLVEKPQGLLVHEDIHESKNTLINQVIKYLFDKKEYDPEIEKTFVPASVNRLDRNTSGIVMIGKNNETLQNLNEMIRSRNAIKKYYLTIVAGHIRSKGELKGYLLKDEKSNKVSITEEQIPKAKFMHTIYNPIQTNGKYSLLEVEIITGRTHQIRLHLASTGNPIIGDEKYGDKKINQSFRQEFDLKNQFLHAYKIYFETCIGNLKYLEGKTFYSALPKKLENMRQVIFKESC